MYRFINHALNNWSDWQVALAVGLLTFLLVLAFGTVINDVLGAACGCAAGRIN